MTRLLTIVNERKKIKNEYRKYLEDKYIDGKKAEENKHWHANHEKMREDGVQVGYTKEESIIKSKEHWDKLQSKIEQNFESMDIKRLDTEADMAEMVSDEDIKFAAEA